MGVVASKWQQLGGRRGRGRRRRSTLEDESRRLQMASTAALEEQHAAALARERSRHRQEVAQLRACRLRCQNHGTTTTHHQHHHHVEEGGPDKSTSCRVVVEHGRESESESETVERWKRLYLEIKTELDDLIESYSSSSAGRERRCCRCSCGAEAVELRGRLSAMERDAARREREMDILRQSLRILTLTDNNAAAAGSRRCAPLSIRRLYCCLSACPGPGPGPGGSSTASTCSSSNPST